MKLARCIVLATILSVPLWAVSFCDWSDFPNDCQTQACSNPYEEGPDTYLCVQTSSGCCNCAVSTMYCPGGATGVRRTRYQFAGAICQSGSNPRCEMP